LLVRDDKNRELYLLAVKGSGQSMKAGPFELSAAAALVSAQEVLLAGEGALALAGKTLAGKPGAAAASPEAARALRRMWETAQPATHPAQGKVTAARPTASPLKEAWRFRGFTRPGEPIRGVGLSAEPPAGNLADLTDALLPLWFGDVRWPQEAKPKLTFTLPQEEEIAEIEVRTGLITNTNVRPDLAKLPSLPPARAEFSTDDFRADIRTEDLKWRSSYQAEQAHKAEFFPFGMFTVEGLKQKARQMRLTFDQGFTAKEITLRRSRPGDTRLQKMVVTDLRGDGTPELLVSSSQNELVALALDGKELWRQRFRGPINCVHAAALGTGPEETVLVGTLESWVYAFSAEGKELWRADTLFLGGDCVGPFSLATWRPQQGGPLEIIVGNYDRCSFFSTTGERLGWSMAAGAFETMTLAPGLDLNDDGGEDALMFNNWRAISFIDGAQRKMTKAYGAPGGWGICFDCLDPSPQDPLALVVADMGAQVFHMKGGPGRSAGQVVFALDSFPISSCAWGDVNGDGRPEIILGKRDGFVLALSEMGELLKRVAIGEPVLDLVLLPAAGGRPPRLLLAGESTLRELTADLGEVWTTPNPGVEKLKVIPGPKPMVLAANAEAELVLWQVGP
jgi:hypothetical protein